MSTQYLLITDVDAIQRYVFASVRMATIVGASRIVARLDDELERLASDPNGSCRADRAVVSGGNGLFVFDDTRCADNFAQEAVKRFREASVRGTLTTSEVVPFQNDSDYFATLERALQSLKARKRAGVTSDESVELGLSSHCEYCGAEAAQPKLTIVGDETRRIGLECRKKLDARNEFDNRPEKDFNKLAGEDYLAIMAIDGDGLGRRLHSLKTPQEFADFSRQIKQCLKNAIESGLAVARGETPYHILYQGGDDLVIACPSQWALPFAEAFSKSLENAQQALADDERVGFSIGISIANSGFPFRTSYRIANDLLRNAKWAAKEHKWPEGAIDFAMISEASGDVETLLAERKITNDSTSITLTGRPYRLASGKARSLSKLRQACEFLHANDFSRNRLYSLRNTLNRSRIEDTKTSIGVASADATIRRMLAAFQTRIERFESLKSAWESAMKCLSFDDEASTFPQGDLADSLYLWENSFGD